MKPEDYLDLKHYCPPAGCPMALVTLNVGRWDKHGRPRFPRAFTVEQTLRIFRAVMSDHAANHRMLTQSRADAALGDIRTQYDWTVATESAEPTLVFRRGVPVFLLPIFEEYVEWLCYRLAQDCIAVETRVLNGETATISGQLIGPDAAEWGPFDYSKFIRL